MSEEAELAVRRYLNFLEDPASIVDSKLVAKLEEQLSSSSDTIERLHASAALEKAKSADGESVRAAFVKYARDYANAFDLPASAFRAMGVSESTLTEAGFNAAGKGTKGKKTAPKPSGRLRAPKVAKSAISEHILGIKGVFTLNDVMSNFGGSIGTVNTVVKALIADGSIKNLGPDTEHQGRGRARIRYSR
jgi:hypothetical protein